MEDIDDLQRVIRDFSDSNIISHFGTENTRLLRTLTQTFLKTPQAHSFKPPMKFSNSNALMSRYFGSLAHGFDGILKILFTTVSISRDIRAEFRRVSLPLEGDCRIRGRHYRGAKIHHGSLIRRSWIGTRASRRVNHLPTHIPMNIYVPDKPILTTSAF